MCSVFFLRKIDRYGNGFNWGLITWLWWWLYVLIKSLPSFKDIRQFKWLENHEGTKWDYIGKIKIGLKRVTWGRNPLGLGSGFAFLGKLNGERAMQFFRMSDIEATFRCAISSRAFKNATGRSSPNCHNKTIFTKLIETIKVHYLRVIE